MTFTSTNDLADLGKECLTSLFAPVVQVDSIDPSMLVANYPENLHVTEAEELLAFYSECMPPGPAGLSPKFVSKSFLMTMNRRSMKRLTTMSLLKMLMTHRKRVCLPPVLASMATRNEPPELLNKHRRSGRPRVYYRTVKAELSFGDEDLAEVETFGWDQVLKQWTSSDGTSVPDLDYYFRRRLVVSQGTHLQMRDLERHYRLVQLWIKRRGMKGVVHLRFNGYADWVGTRRGSLCVRMGLTGVRRALRGELAPAEVTRT